MIFFNQKLYLTLGELMSRAPKSAHTSLASPSPLTSSISNPFDKVYNLAAGSQRASSQRLVPKLLILCSALKIIDNKN